MSDLIEKFIRDESGAVTVDWVVLTAAIVGLGVGVITVFAPSTVNIATLISAEVAEISVGD